MVHYNFERQQRMKVAVYDADDTASDAHRLGLSKQDYLGASEFDMAEIASGHDMHLKRALVGKGARGYCTVTAEERITFKRVLTVDISGHKLAKRDGCASQTTASSRNVHLTCTAACRGPGMHTHVRDPIVIDGTTVERSR